MPIATNRRSDHATPEAILMFEAEWLGKFRGRDQGRFYRAMNERFRSSATNYVIALNSALSDPENRRFAPEAFDHLVAIRDARTSQRAARSFGPPVSIAPARAQSSSAA